MSRFVLSASILSLAAGSVLFLVSRAIVLPDHVQFAYRIAILGGVSGAAVAWLARRFRGTRHADALLTNLILLSGTCVATLAASEGILRYVFKDLTTTADIRTYFSYKWDAKLERNFLGFRERVISPEKLPGSYRIAVVGDSFTFGQGIRREDRFSNLLEERLAAMPASERRFEVLNFGRRGTETEDHVEILRESVLSMNPDFLLLQWYENDVEGRDKSQRPRPTRLVPSDYLTGILRRNSVLHFLLQRQYAVLQRAAGLIESYQSYMEARFQDPEGPASRAARNHLREFIATCREAGVPVGIALFPDLGGQTDLAFLRDRVLDQCQDEEIPCLDLSDMLEGVEDPRSLWVNRFDPHPGPLPNRIAADRLMERFGPIWMGEAETD